jgi:hypothetical protein
MTREEEIECAMRPMGRGAADQVYGRPADPMTADAYLAEFKRDCAQAPCPLPRVAGERSCLDTWDQGAPRAGNPALRKASVRCSA